MSDDIPLVRAWAGIMEKSFEYNMKNMGIEMSESKTWLPRFKEVELLHIGISDVGCKFAADLFNKRLEEFEKTCVRMIGNGRRDSNWMEGGIGTHESLMLPPRPIKRGVSKAKIIEALKHMRSDAQEQIAEQIEREGIID